MKIGIKSCLMALACMLIYKADAQSTKIYNDADAAFKAAKEYFQNEQYSLAYPLLKEVKNDANYNSLLPTTVADEARYYTLVCGLMLNDANVVNEANVYTERAMNAYRVQMLYYFLGEYYFRQKKYQNTIQCFTKTTISNLTNSQIESMKFHKAYSYFVMQQFAEAKPLFNSIRQIPNNPDYVDANYYYAFISFYDKNYEEALTSFKIAENDETYHPVVPFYIAEILYFRGDKDSALIYSIAQLKKSKQYYDLQFRQLVGHLLFDKKEYDQALPYLEAYVNKSDKVKREDMYELSFCYYSAGKWDKCIEGFKQLGGKDDSLAQNCMYLLADAYLKTGDKVNARNAFLFCAGNNSNKKQKEVSQFSYAKLSYELGYLDIALTDLKAFMQLYPESSFKNEAREIEVSVLANTSNYKEALILFDSLPVKNDNVKKIYPKILYGRAVEEINDGHLDNALSLFNQIMKAPYNSGYLPYAYFWKGEMSYKSGNYDDAISNIQSYLKNPLVNGEVNSLNAKYIMGYCLLKKENYKAALDNFGKDNKHLATNSSAIEQDAYVRSADCEYMMKQYKDALKKYDNVIALGLSASDYATYQKAIIAGAYNKINDKITLLESIEGHYPQSSLIADANMEIASTYIANERYNEAIPYLNLVIKNKNNTALLPQAYLKLGIVYFNLKKDNESLGTFQSLVTSYPNSSESDEAVDYIRNIFIHNQKPDEFVAFMKSNGKTVSYSEADSLTYKSAMIRYDEGDYASAAKGYKDYLSKFPEGRYSLEANYFGAEIAILNKDVNAALGYYKAVAAKAPNKYAERSALQSARICYFNLKDYPNASLYFTQVKVLATQQEDKLEAMRGLLRSQFKLKQWKEASANAKDLLLEKTVSTEDRMYGYMILGKNSQNDSLGDDAINAYKQVIATGKSELSAEAQYQIAVILYTQNKLKDAEKAAFDVIRKTGSYEYWVTSSYLLLGDIYLKENDLFNAEATFKSVADNATIDELKKTAQAKLLVVADEKNKVNKVEATP